MRIAAVVLTAAPTCTWTPNDTTSVSYRASVDVSSGGLEALYQRCSTIPAFEPTDVHSYPAVHTDHDGTPAGQCTVNVGVADDTLHPGCASDAAKGSTDPARGEFVRG
jgi:hypothetical protein